MYCEGVVMQKSSLFSYISKAIILGFCFFAVVPVSYALSEGGGPVDDTASSQPIRGESDYIRPFVFPFLIPPQEGEPAFPECDTDNPECQASCTSCMEGCGDDETCRISCLAAWALCIHPMEFRVRCYEVPGSGQLLPDDIPGVGVPIEIAPYFGDRNPGTGNPDLFGGIRCRITF